MKLTVPKPKISIRMVTTLILALIILAEIYMAYTYLYLNLSPQPVVSQSNNIVRLNRSALSDVSQYLTGLDNFRSVNPTLNNPNPFKYSQ